MREWPASKHNVVTFTRDGQDAHPPSFCVLEVATDLPQTAFIRSVAREYNGLHWARNLIWDKNRVVFMVDEMTAAENGDYQWRAIRRDHVGLQHGRGGAQLGDRGS